MAQKYSNGSNIYQIFLMAPIWNGIGFRMPMMHCPTFGSLASLKYLKTCFQISQDIFKISQDIYQMYQDIDEMAQTFIKSGMALVSGCPKHCPTFGSLIEHSPHLHKHTYIHNPEVDIAEGAAAAHARTREGNFWIFASEAQILRRPPLA